MPEADKAVITALTPGIGTTVNPASRTAATTSAPGVAHGGRASIGNQRYRLACLQALEQSLGRLLLIVLMHGDEFFGDAIMVEQARAMARIFCRNRVHDFERIDVRAG